ncbi:MAG TPA: GH92 family glycosyl hydrolase, partial [Prolixibacteraceae bacterium]|nr:GH92 family glycosyl hydrolase [Prolixibacteraceae bacterium]
MRKIVLFLFVLLFSGVLVSCSDLPAGPQPVDWVDPYIGTDYHGHVFLGASVPYGAVQLGPTNFVKGWDWCSGYHYSDSIVTGFSHTHLSGTGIGDLGDVLLMPYTGAVKVLPGRQEDISTGYASLYSHDQESARPGYYQVKLLKYGINVELTASERVGFHRYTFPANDTARIIIDLKAGIGWDRPTATSLKQVDEHTFTGFRHSSGWAADQRLFFAVKISEPVAAFQLFEADSLVENIAAGARQTKGVLTFSGMLKKPVLVKVGISPVSEENALANVEAEIPHWEFDRVVREAREKWNRELSRILVKSTDTAQMRTFYTSMYHLMIAPALFNDANGDYRGTDKKVYSNPGFNNYTIFSLWDTYRAAHPLFTIIDPERVNDFVKTMLTIYDQQGSLPVWHLMGNETGTMVGNHSIPVIADAWFKGIGDFDAEKALLAMK